MQYTSGTIIDDRYRVLELIGLGGMGVVYRAVDVELQREVAVKVLHSNFPDEETSQRFKREGKIASDLEHPNIVQFFRYGYVEDCPYIAMEHLSGESLRDVLDREHVLEAQRTLEIAVQVCRAMQHAHQEKVIHRDLKPSNVMLLQSPVRDFVKVVDFGLARVLELDASQGLTQTGSILGTAQYMSPEQCQGLSAGAPADIYSLGCIIFEALTGRPPFEAETPVGLIHKHVCEPVPALNIVAPETRFPDGLQQVLSKALSKEPSRRYTSMALFESDLGQVMDGKALRFESDGAVPALKRSTGVATVLILLLLLGVAALVVQRLRDQQAPAAMLSAGSANKSRVVPLGLERRSCESLLDDAERYWLNGASSNKGEAFFRAAIAASKNPAVDPQIRLRCYWTYAAALKMSRRFAESTYWTNVALDYVKRCPNVPITTKFQAYAHAAVCYHNLDDVLTRQYLQKSEELNSHVDSDLRGLFNAQLNELRADLLFEEGQFDKACQAMSAAVEGSGRAQDIANRKVKLADYMLTAKKKNFDTIYQEIVALPLEAGSAGAYRWFAEHLFVAGKRREGQQIAEKALKTIKAGFGRNVPDVRIEVLLLLAKSALQDANEAQARRYLEEADKVVRDSRLDDPDLLSKLEKFRQSLNK